MAFSVWADLVPYSVPVMTLLLRGCCLDDVVLSRPSSQNRIQAEIEVTPWQYSNSTCVWNAEQVSASLPESLGCKCCECYQSGSSTSCPTRCQCYVNSSLWASLLARKAGKHRVANVCPLSRDTPGMYASYSTPCMKMLIPNELKIAVLVCEIEFPWGILYKSLAGL